MTDSRHAGKLKLLLIALVFLGPLVLSFVLYYFVDDWRPVGSTENGILLTPVLLPDGPLLPVDSSPRFRDKWTLVAVGYGQCDDICQKMLYESRQIRRSLGKEMSRVQRIFIINRMLPALDSLQSEHPDLIIVTELSDSAAGFLDAAGNSNPGDIYLVDPIGNLMMRFPTSTGMKGIKEDLVHLLKASRIG